MIDKNTFGNSETYKMLNFINEKVDELQKKDKAYVSKFICKFNKTLNDIKIVYNTPYILKLIKDDYLSRVDRLKVQEELKSYLKNYIKARTKN